MAARGDVKISSRADNIKGRDSLVEGLGDASHVRDLSVEHWARTDKYRGRCALGIEGKSTINGCCNTWVKRVPISINEKPLDSVLCRYL